MIRDDLARKLYEAYGRNADWLTWNGSAMPPWGDLGDAVQSHWAAAVKEAFKLVPKVLEAEAKEADEPAEVKPTGHVEAKHKKAAMPDPDIDPDPTVDEALPKKK